MIGIVLLGAPGAGKGTQAAIITQKLAIPQISTGDMLRSAIKNRTEYGLLAQVLMEQGELVPDDLVIKMVKERLAAADCKNGFLFDGFPRTIAQADSLKLNSIKIDYVIEFQVPDNEIIQRLSGRRVHLLSGRTYHIVHKPPHLAGFDDISGEPLIQRDDDREEIVKHRLKTYHQQTAPLIDYYASDQQVKYIIVDGMKSVAAVSTIILHALET